MPTGSQRKRVELASIERAKADRFLAQLEKSPFIAVVVEGDRVHFYARADVSADDLALIRQTIDHLTEESQG